MLHQNLKYFCTVVEEMNITRAAERLHMSQQTLSNHIARLESECGVALFERKPKLALTTAGHRFYEYAQRVLSQDAELFSQFDEITSQKDKKLTIGITQTRSMTYLPTVMPEFKAQNPDIACDVRICQIYELEKKLLAGEFDLVIAPNVSVTAASMTDARLERVLVQNDPICLTIPRVLLRTYLGDEETEALIAHPASALKTLHERGILAKLPYALTGVRLSEIAHDFLSRYVPEPRVIAELHDQEVMFAVPFAEACATFLSRSVLSRLSAQASAPLTIDIGHPVPVSVIYSHDRPVTVPMKKFIALARSKMGAK